MYRFRRASIHAGFRPTAGNGLSSLDRLLDRLLRQTGRPRRGAGEERTAARLGPASSPAWTKRCRRPVLARMERTHRRGGTSHPSQSRLPGRPRRGSEFPKEVCAASRRPCLWVCGFQSCLAPVIPPSAANLSIRRKANINHFAPRNLRRTVKAWPRRSAIDHTTSSNKRCHGKTNSFRNSSKDVYK